MGLNGIATIATMDNGHFVIFCTCPDRNAAEHLEIIALPIVQGVTDGMGWIDASVGEA